MSSANTVLQGRSVYLQRPMRALLYGLAIWFIWVTLVITAFYTLPKAFVTSPLYVSMQVISLVTLLLAFAIHYVRKVRESTFREGLLIGLVWTVVFIASDLIHNTLMHPSAVDNYFSTIVPSYIVMPITTTLVMGYLKPKP
jgi:hypothetical protein